MLLYEPDLYQLAEHASLAEATTEVRGAPFIKREEKGRENHVDVDGLACTFLDEEGRCTLQADHDWKPTRCSIFPLEISSEDGDIVVDVRDDAERNCQGMDVGERRLIDHLDAFLPPTLWELDTPDTRIRL